MPPIPPRVVVHSEGVRQVLRSPGMLARAMVLGRAMQAAAGPGVEVVSDIGPNRVRVEVRTATFEAMRRELKHRTLSSSIDAARR